MSNQAEKEKEKEESESIARQVMEAMLVIAALLKPNKNNQPR